MSFGICPICDGSGFRNVFEGTKCYTCNGLGVLQDSDPDEEEYEDYVSPEEQAKNNAMERGDDRPTSAGWRG